MTAGSAFTVDTLRLVDPKKGGIRKRLGCRLSRSYMLHLGDDDLHLSTRLFNATPHSSGRSHRRSRHEEAMSDFLRPLLPVLWRWRIHERLAVRVSLNMKDIPRIYSNTCFTLKVDSALATKESVISDSTPKTPNTPNTPNNPNTDAIHMMNCTV